MRSVLCRKALRYDPLRIAVADRQVVAIGRRCTDHHHWACLCEASYPLLALFPHFVGDY